MMTTTFSMNVLGSHHNAPNPPGAEAAQALNAALHRIARLEKTLAELLLKNEQLRQKVQA